MSAPDSSSTPIVEVDLSRRPFVCTGDSGDRYQADALIIATGAQARWLGLPTRGDVPRLRRLGLRDLRRVLLPRQGGRRGRRRQHRGRGGALPDQPRRQGDAGPPPRHAAGREDPAGPAVPQPEDRRGLGQRRCEEIVGEPDAGAVVTGVRLRNVQDRRRAASCRPTACSSRSATRRTPSCSQGKLPLDAEGYILTTPDSTATDIAGRLRGRRREGQGLPPGGDRRRAWAAWRRSRRRSCWRARRRAARKPPSRRLRARRSASRAERPGRQ